MGPVIGAVATMALASGCFAHGTLSYRDNPDLKHVKLATGATKTEPPGHLGVVEASAWGFGSCSDLAATALRDLLAEGRALDGTTVEEVKFRARWHWTGRPLCVRWMLFPYLLQSTGCGAGLYGNATSRR